MAGESWRFTFADEGVVVDTTGDLRNELAEFRSFKTQQLHVMLAEGGWLRIKRDLRGYIRVGYHLARVRDGAAVHGEVVMDPDSAEGLCGEIEGLL